MDDVWSILLNPSLEIFWFATWLPFGLVLVCILRQESRRGIQQGGDDIIVETTAKSGDVLI
jgi:hypothetical protein